MFQVEKEIFSIDRFFS